MKLKLLIFLWFCGGSLFAQEQDSTCFKIERSLTNYYSYFFSFDADYEQFFNVEKIKNQQIETLQFAISSSNDIHCSTMEFGFDSNGKVESVTLLNSELPDIWIKKLVVIRDPSNRITQKIKAPTDEKGLIDTIGQYSIKIYQYNQENNLLKTIEERRNGEPIETIEEFQYDAQNRIKRRDYDLSYSTRDIKEHFIYSYKKNKTQMRRFLHFPSEKGDYLINQIGSKIKKHDKLGRVIIEKEKHGESNLLSRKTKFKYDDLGLLISLRTKNSRRYASKYGNRIYEPFKSEYKNGILNSFQFRSFYTLKRIE